jgi:hypothetical protein
VSDGIPIGTFNHVEVVIGLRGYGKSTYCVDRALELQRESGGYVIGHSLGARLPKELPDGTKVPIHYYENLDKLSRGLKRHPQEMHILATGDADVLLRFARDLSSALRKRAWRRVHGIIRRWSPMSNMDSIRCRPIIVVFDESVALTMNLGKAGARGEDNKYFKEAIYSARHEHIAYLFQIQDMNALGPSLQTQATNYIVFHTEHQWSLNAIRGAGATPEQIAEIPNLEIGEYVEFGPAVKKPTVSREAPEPDNQTSSTSKPPSGEPSRSASPSEGR